MDKYLIINADDCGMCNAANRAIADLFACGGITSSTIMAPCPWSIQAAEFAAKNPQYAFGVHFTTTSEWGTYRWAPVSKGNTSSLCDEEGFMWHESDMFEKNCNLDEVRDELIAQIEKLRKYSLNPSHFDNHMGSLYGIYTGRTEILEMTLGICARYGMPFRIPATMTRAQLDNKMLDISVPEEMITGLLGKIREKADEFRVAIPDYLMPGDWDGPQDESYENFRDYIFELYKTFDNGVTETYIHPSVECDELKSITGSWHRRVWEYRLFSDPKTQDYIKSLGIKLINYRDLKRIRGYSD